MFDVWESGPDQIQDEGEHEAICPDCEYEFEVTTHVIYSFESPAMIAEDEAEDTESDE